MITLGISKGVGASSAIAVGSPFTLHVTAQGTAPFTYKWMRNGWPIDQAKEPSAATADYHVDSASILGETQYWCIVSNAAGQTTSDIAYIRVTEVVAPPPPPPPVIDIAAARQKAIAAVKVLDPSANPQFDPNWKTWNNVRDQDFAPLAAELKRAGVTP